MSIQTDRTWTGAATYKDTSAPSRVNSIPIDSAWPGAATYKDTSAAADYTVFLWNIPGGQSCSSLTQS